MSARRDHLARNAVVVMTALFLLISGVAIFQQIEIQNLRRADCAAVRERATRAVLYDRLIEAYKADRTVSDQTRSKIIAAYRVQRAEVNRAAQQSDNEGCRFLPQGGAK